MITQHLRLRTMPVFLICNVICCFLKGFSKTCTWQHWCVIGKTELMSKKPLALGQKPKATTYATR